MVEDVDGRLIDDPVTVPARDAYVVCREPVAEVVGTFVTTWSRDHAPDGGRHAAFQERTKVTQVRAYEWLAEKTRQLDRVRDEGISEKSLASMFRRNPGGDLRYQTLDLRTADLLLTAIGRHDLFPHPGVEGGDPRLMPMRRGTRACCAKSMTGTLSPPPTSSSS